MTRPRIFLEVGFTRQKSGEFRQAVGERVLVGRAPECTVQVDSDQVSREHFVLSCVDGLWKVEDLGSSNGTWHNKKRVKKGRVHVGTVLRCGPDGPKIRIVGLYPDADEPADDLQETRLALEEDPPEPKPRRAPRRAPVPPPPPAPPRPVPAHTPWPLIFGLVFGIALGFEVFVDTFPYESVAAPGLLAGKVAVTAAPEVTPERLTLVLIVSLALYWGLVGFAVQRLVRRWPLLACLAVVHLVGFFLMRGTLS